MTATWIIVLLFVSFILARMYKSTKMWWTLVFAIMLGLLTGILSKELLKSNDDNSSITQLVEQSESIVGTCMQSLVAVVTEDATTCLTGVAGYYVPQRDMLSDGFTKVYRNNGRNPPDYEDDS